VAPYTGTAHINLNGERPLHHQDGATCDADYRSTVLFGGNGQQTWSADFHTMDNLER
jgi:hypothetical protein